MERRLAAILAADVVGYTRLIGANEAGTLRRLTELRQQDLEPLIAEHHGREVKLMGDGLLVEFASVVDALTCSVAWQKGGVERQSEGDDDIKLQFRIGINLGDVIVEGDDILVLEDDVALIDADPEFYMAILGQFGVALSHGALDSGPASAQRQRQGPLGEPRILPRPGEGCPVVGTEDLELWLFLSRRVHNPLKGPAHQFLGSSQCFWQPRLQNRELF
jgi:hypothetical protein